MKSFKRKLFRKTNKRNTNKRNTNKRRHTIKRPKRMRLQKGGGETWYDRLSEEQKGLLNWDELSENHHDRALDLLEHEDNRGKIDWYKLCYNTNPRAIELLKQNPDNINWTVLSSNPSAGELLLKKENSDKIDWDNLSKNPNPQIYEYMMKHKNKINWKMFAQNTHPEAITTLIRHITLNRLTINHKMWEGISENSSVEAIRLLESHPDKIDWFMLSRNPGERAFHLLITHPDEVDKKDIQGVVTNTNQQIFDHFVTAEYLRNYDDSVDPDDPNEPYKYEFWFYMAQNPAAINVLMNSDIFMNFSVAVVANEEDDEEVYTVNNKKATFGQIAGNPALFDDIIGSHEYVLK
jgi:hypothetical protein